MTETSSYFLDLLVNNWLKLLPFDIKTATEEDVDI